MSVIDTSNYNSEDNSSSTLEDIPYPIARTIRYVDDVLITFKFDYLKLSKQMSNYCANNLDISASKWII